MYFTIKCIKNTTNKAYRPNAHLSDTPNALYRKKVYKGICVCI